MMGSLSWRETDLETGQIGKKQTLKHFFRLQSKLCFQIYLFFRNNKPIWLISNIFIFSFFFHNWILNVQQFACRLVSMSQIETLKMHRSYLCLDSGNRHSGSETFFFHFIINLKGTMQKMILAVYWVAVKWDHRDPWDLHVVIQTGPLGKSMVP